MLRSTSCTSSNTPVIPYQGAHLLSWLRPTERGSRKTSATCRRRSCWRTRVRGAKQCRQSAQIPARRTVPCRKRCSRCCREAGSQILGTREVGLPVQPAAACTPSSLIKPRGGLHLAAHPHTAAASIKFSRDTVTCSPATPPCLAACLLPPSPLAPFPSPNSCPRRDRVL